ncbi:unnamed protein product, partial [marine sediment metagenome]
RPEFALPLLIKKNSDHPVSVPAITNPIQEGY